MRGSDDFFHNRMNQKIDLRHPPAMLAWHMPRQEIEVSLAKLLDAGLSKAGRPCQMIEAHTNFPVSKVIYVQ